MVVAFGDKEAGKKWKEDKGCEFRVLLDKDKKLYSYVGLDRSVLPVCYVHSLVLCAMLYRNM